MFTNNVIYALASAALLMESAAAQTRTPISQATYDDLHHYTVIQSASIPDSCDHPPFDLRVIASLKNSTTDSRATIFQDDVRREFIVSFPGTDFLDPKEVLGDLTIPLVPYTPPAPATCDGCLIHLGFINDWLSLEATITSILQSSLKAQPGYALKITGHSLGASLANLALSSLTAQGLDVATVYTMGEGRIGNAAYSDHIDGISGATNTTGGNPGIYYRITHREDGVPRLLPEPTYLHPQTEFFESTYESSVETTFRCYGKEAPDGNNQYGNNTLEFGSSSILDDHTYYTNVVLNSTTTTCNA